MLGQLIILQKQYWSIKLTVETKWCNVYNEQRIKLENLISTNARKKYEQFVLLIEQIEFA